jgi:serine/threonine protein kinase
VTCEHCGEQLNAAASPSTCTRCGALRGTPEPPVVLGRRFRLERTIGVGSMGVVHLAHDLKSSGMVALKQVAPEHVLDPDAHYRFAREAAALAAVRHPNVVRVAGVGEDDGGRSFVAMEYVAGPSLEDVIVEAANRGEFIEITRALTIVRALAEGLAAVHSAGFIHRDVKPTNVLIEETTGRPVLLDFGLARSPARASSKSIGAGTPWYMAPEQLDDDEARELELSARTDVYALGCTAYEILTASPPFPSCDLDELRALHLRQVPPPPSCIRKELAPLDAPLARSLAKHPGQRFPTPIALAEALEDAWTAATC